MEYPQITASEYVKHYNEPDKRDRLAAFLMGVTPNDVRNMPYNKVEPYYMEVLVQCGAHDDHEDLGDSVVFALSQPLEVGGESVERLELSYLTPAMIDNLVKAARDKGKGHIRVIAQSAGYEPSERNTEAFGALRVGDFVHMMATMYSLIFMETL